MKKKEATATTEEFEIKKDQELCYYITLSNIDDRILFTVTKVFIYLKNNNTMAKEAIEAYILNRLSKYSKEIGERRFAVYQDILSSVENNKIKPLWAGVSEDYLRDFWEVFFLIWSDFYIIQQLAMQQ